MAKWWEMTDVTHPGLSPAQVAQRVSAGQVNRLPARSGRSVADIVRANVFTRINALLGVLLVIVLATGEWINAAFGLLIIANSAVGIIQEVRAKRTLDRLAVVGQAQPLVRRTDSTTRRQRDGIVIDDIIELTPGDQIVVDGQIVEAELLEVDESLLSGESDPQPKTVGQQVWSGSFVVSGAGAYRATKVGAHAYAAQLTAQATKFSLADSHLQAGINQILRAVTWLLIPVGVATILMQLRITPDWRQAVLAMAGALVPMVPEGLVLLTSMAFALGVIRLGRRHCLVQELPAIEVLARVDVICTDKTGTLTHPKLRVAKIIELAQPSLPLGQVLAQFAAADQHPNASLQAITCHVGTPEQTWPVAARAAFSPATKWSGVSFTSHGNWVLGAPEVIADSLAAGQAEALARQGTRVLLLGQSDRLVSQADVLDHISAVCLVVLDQQIRDDAAPTLGYFATQGVRVVLISGDNAHAVGAVARRLGVRVDTPVDARQLDDAQLAASVAVSNVFGRVNPNQKRTVVRALQADGHTVAMTGDGVNDVLALKDADLGVAMGSGAPASRAVAKIVLLDDRFATLAQVVGEGRRVLGNIERVAALFLTKTIYSALLALLVAVTALPFPFQPIHVTITGWFTIGIPAFLLSLAPNHARARPGFVTRVLQLGLPAGAVIAVATFLTIAVLGNSRQATTAALATLIVAATWLLGVVARPYRWWRLGLVVVAYACYVVVFAWPVAQRVFMLDSSNARFMSTGVLIGLAAAALVEATWWLRARLSGQRAQFWALS